MKFVHTFFVISIHICICCGPCIANEDTQNKKNLRLLCEVDALDEDGSLSSTFQKDLNLACQLRLRDGTVFSLPVHHDTKKNTTLQFTTYVSNSTLKQVYRWSRPLSAQGSWKFIISRSDFFEEYSDWRVPKVYPVLVLKWSIVTELCSPIFTRCFTHSSVLSYPGDDLPSTAADNENVMPDFTEKHYRTISVQFPCQPSSRIMIVSSKRKTLVFTSWDAFKAGTNTVHDIGCDLQGLSTCGNSSIVYDAVIVHNKLLLVTSLGLLSTNSIQTRCWWNASLPGCEIKYSLVSLPLSGPIDWSASRLSYSPMCVMMDHLNVEDEVAVLNLAQEDSSVVLLSAAPYEDWSVAGGVPQLSSESIASYSAQTRSMIVVNKEAENGGYVVASYLIYAENNDSSPESTDRWMFTDFTPSLAVLLSNKFYYLAGKSAIWCSVDGGIFFAKIFTLADDEDVIDVAVHDMKKSVGFLTSTGRILIGRIGVREVTVFQPAIDGILHIMYDDIGMLYAFKLDAGGNTLKVVVEKVKGLESGPCSFSLHPTGYIYTQSLVHVDIGSTFHFDITGSTTLDKGTNSILSVTIANPSVMRAEIERNAITPYLERLVLVVHGAASRGGMSTITFAFTDAESTCSLTSFTLTVSFSCPPQKHLRFDYRSFVPPNELLTMEDYVNETLANPMLQTLPANYRPPSSIAVAIPLSKNVYNFHPEKESRTGILEYGFAEKFAVSEYCEGTELRKECSCNSALKFSSLEAHSDCREKVYQVKYGIEYYIDISIAGDDNSEGRSYFSLADHYVYLQEVNGRTSDVYQITERQGEVCSEVEPGNCLHYEDTTTEKRKISEETLNFMSHHTGEAIYNATTLQIKFLGTGLFHFRIVLANGFSYCRLQDEFQVYVTNAPLPFPVGTIIRLTVSVIVAGALAGIYMYSLASSLPPATTNKADASDEAVAKAPHRRNDSSFLMEDDVTALRQKFRASFKTTNKLSIPSTK